MIAFGRSGNNFLLEILKNRIQYHYRPMQCTQARVTKERVVEPTVMNYHMSEKRSGVSCFTNLSYNRSKLIRKFLFFIVKNHHFYNLL